MRKLWKSLACGAVVATLTLAPYNAYAMTQDETVYVKLYETGSLNYTTVNKHLLNDLRDTKLHDMTILNGVENLNGSESFTRDGDQIVWNADGHDIYYSGKTDKNLPIQLAVEYKLDGETKSVDEMLGRSGHVEIHLEYKNLSKVGNMYTPFVAAMSTILPEATTRNLTVTNGKAISNGNMLMVAAIAAPGLYDSLQLDELKSLDEVTLDYETDCFELNDIYSLITPKFLDEEDLKIFDELDGLYGNIDKLSNSSKELVSGTNKLQGGISDLRAAVVKAKDQLAATGSLIDEVTLNKISSVAAATAQKQVAAQRNTIYAEIDNQVRQMASSLLDTTAIKNEIAGSAPAMVQQICAQQVTTGAMSPEQCVPLMTQVVGGVLGQVSGATDSKMSAISTSTITDAMFNKIYPQMQNLAAQTAATTARSVATQVASSIQEGMGDKLTVMMDGMIGGIDKLVAGAGDLSKGMKQFDQEGIQTLNNVVNGKLKTTSSKLKQLEKLADQYNNYSGISEGVEGKTKFVLMIEGRKATR